MCVKKKEKQKKRKSKKTALLVTVGTSYNSNVL